MSNELATVEGTSTAVLTGMIEEEYVTAKIDGQLFGLQVLVVHDILKERSITKIPLAPNEVAGSLNLRGHIITAIDLRSKLGLPAREEGAHCMSIVVEHEGDMYSLIVDGVGEVLKVPMRSFEDNPSTLDPKWKTYSKGIFRLDDCLMVSLDINQLLGFY